MSAELAVIGRSVFMLTYLWVAIGGALGSVGRFWLNGLISARFGETFPWGTMLINITGSFVIGFFASLTGTEGRWLVSPAFRTFFMIGICGGYTTFSSFSLQTLNLANEGEWLAGGRAMSCCRSFCVMAGVWLGWLLANNFNEMK
jgi:CrcB protein